MKAAVMYGKNDIRLEEVPDPCPGPGEVVLRVRAAGISADDIKSLLGQGAPRRLPQILGHEVAGEIAAVGKHAAGFESGQRVVVFPYAFCGRCDYCLQGRQNLCSQRFGLADGITGGFAEYVLIPRQIVAHGGILPIPEHLSFEAAALTEPLSCCVAAARTNRVAPGARVVVVGSGPMGLLHLKVNKEKGAQVIMIDKLARRLNYAAQMGADEVIDAGRVDPVKEVKKITRGDGAEVVIIALGIPEVIEASLPMVRKGGILNIFGGPAAGFIQLDPARIRNEEIVITGNFASTPADFEAALKLLGEGRIVVDDLISDRFHLDQVQDAISRAKQQDMLKGVFVLP
ncbi:MAG: alcohol dehydrogenase catalytic domain-containing protein [Firmicutes bacterium]|nr:alcohol dehydrogenase catalytic domain-containing protein [Bacillota bacterium]